MHELMKPLVCLFLSGFNNKVQYTSRASLTKEKNTRCDLNFPYGFVVAGVMVSGYDRKETHPRPPLIHLEKVK